MFFATDSLAIGAIMRAREKGIDVPRKLAIAGYGDLDTAEQIMQALTTIYVASYDMGLKAGQDAAQQAGKTRRWRPRSSERR